MNITYPITLSHHGSYKQFNKQCLRVKAFIEEHLDIISRSFTLRPDLDIRLRPLPRQSKSGSGGHGKVELDVTKGLRSIIKTLCHELTHEEQYHMGRLKGSGQVKSWNDVPVKVVSPAQSFQRYQALPWEAEARERADEAIIQIESELGIISDDVI